MKQYDHLLDSLERKYNGEGKIFPVKRHRCLMSCYYCELYTMKGNSGKAQAYLDQATAYLDSSFGDRGGGSISADKIILLLEGERL